VAGRAQCRGVSGKLRKITALPKAKLLLLQANHGLNVCRSVLVSPRMKRLRDVKERRLASRRVWARSAAGKPSLLVPALAAAILFTSLPLASAASVPLIPTDPGTSWVYQMTQENATNMSLDLQESPEKKSFDVTYRMGGAALLDGTDFLKLELYQGNALASIDFVTVDGRGVICAARMNQKDKVQKFDPPQILLATPVKSGTNWTFNGTVGNTKVAQHYQITARESVTVPAGQFRAWRIHCDQTAPTAATIDRWFVPGTGFVKVVTTIRAPSGGVLQRTSLQLKAAPKIAAAPESTATPEPAKISVGLSKSPTGEFGTVFPTDIPRIYARWQGHNLRNQADIRLIWIAEKVPGVANDYQIDEASTVAQGPMSHGIFTLSSPKEGWLPGEYRAEFYLDDALAEAVKIRIAK
jgi:hypothetical protein